MVMRKPFVGNAQNGNAFEHVISLGGKMDFCHKPAL